MSDSVVQTLFRCGVCLEMFLSSDECYSHIITHEVSKPTEQEMPSVQNDAVVGTEDAVSQEVVNPGTDVLQEQTDDDDGVVNDDGPQVLNAISYQDAGTPVDVDEKVEGGVTIADVDGKLEGGVTIAAVDGKVEGGVTIADVDGKVEGGVTIAVTTSDQSNVLDVLNSVEAGVCAEEDSAPELWVGRVGEVLKAHGEGRSTNEDLDIADILINIKQEKSDDVTEEQPAVRIETNDLTQLTNQVAQTAEVQNLEGSVAVQPKVVSKKGKTKSKEKKKSSKTVSTQVKREKVIGDTNAPVPVVRRKKRGEKISSVEECIKTYDCGVCGKRYAILKSLKYHERTHDTKNLHYCDLCNKGFVKPSELSNHKKCHLSEKEKKSQALDSYKCRYCDKEYRIEKSLKHHEKVHELGNRYTCDKCKKSFFKPSDLERHRKVHKPLAKCYICSKPFRDARKLEFHVRQHPELLLQENRTHVKSTTLLNCKYCNKKCSTFSQLCNHVRTHTKKKPFPCDVCGKMFNRVSNMRLHRKLHSGRKPFHCDPCGISFADFANRKRHMKKYHASDDLVQASYKPRCSKVVVVEDLPPAPKLKVRRETLVNELRSAYEDLDVLKKTNDDTDVTSLKDIRQTGKNLVQCREVQGIPQQVQEMITVGNCQIQIPPKVLSTTDIPEASAEQVYVVFEDNPSVCYVLEYEGDKTAGKLLEGQAKSTPEQPMVTEDSGNIEVLVEDATAQEPMRINISAADLEDADSGDAVDCELALNEGGHSDSESEVDPDADDKTGKLSPQKQNRYSLRRHECSVCGLRFKHQGSLKFHFKKHTKEGVMYCEICNAEFYRKSRLRIHMRDHTGERPYKCSDCEQTFKVHYDLTVHMRHHTGFGAITCNHCDKIFYTRRALNAHMRNQSKEKPFSCSRCGKLFKRKDQRRRHMLTHVGNLPFKCHMCERSFGDSSNRKRHIIKNHGKEALETLPKGRISLVKNLKL